MLMQPFAARALYLFLRHHPGRHRHVHHRQPFPGLSAWPRSGVERPAQGVRRLHRGEGARPSPSGRRVLRDARPVRLRQDHDAADDRRAGAADLAAASCSTARTSRCSRARERDIAFVFQLFALYPHMNVRQNIAFPLICQGMPRAEARAKRVEEAARLLRIDHLLDRPVSRLAGGDRQRVALGRAIVREPKCFLMDEPLGALDAEFRELMCQELRALHDRMRRHHRLCHPRPARGDGDGRQDRGDEPRRRRAVRHAAGNLRPAGEHVRRRLHRLAADELPALQRRGDAGRPRVRARRCAMSRSRDRREARRRRAGARACGPSISGSTTAAASAARCSAAEYLGTTQIVTRRDRARRASRRASPADVAVAVGETVGLAFDADACRSSTRRAAGRCAPPATRECRPWLRSSLERRHQAFGRSRAVRTSTSPSRTASFVVLLGPTGAGKTTTLRLIAGSGAPDAATIAIGGAAMAGAAAGASATSPSSSSSTRSIRT